MAIILTHGWVKVHMTRLKCDILVIQIVAESTTTIKITNVENWNILLTIKCSSVYNVRVSLLSFHVDYTLSDSEMEYSPFRAD